jgi:universal stress protein E
MPRHILAAVCNGPRAACIAERAHRLAQDHGARLTLMTVIPRTAHPGRLAAEAARFTEAEARGQLQALLPGARVPLVVAQGRVAATIAATAEELGADLLIIGPNERRNLRARVIGSTADRVLRTAALPALVVRGTVTGAYSNALVAVDFSPAATAAARALVDLCPEIRIQLAHVTDLPLEFEAALLRIGTNRTDITGHYKALKAEGRRRLAEFAADLPDAQQRVFVGDPATTLTRLSRARGVDLLAMGTRGLDSLRAHILGSVAQKVIRDAVCDMLVVPEAAATG